MANKDHETEIKLELIKSREMRDMLENLELHVKSKFSNEELEFHRMVLART